MNELWLIWQNPDQDSRQHYHVGSLFYIDEEYVFKYSYELRRRGLEEATRDGYVSHFSFDDTQKEYRSNLMFAAIKSSYLTVGEVTLVVF